MIVWLNDACWRAAVDSKGAQLIHLCAPGGAELLWQPRNGGWDACAPLLFPIVGRLKDGAYEFKGRQYQLGIHGFISSREFSITYQNANIVCFQLNSDRETLERYPFRFRVNVIFKLEDGCLTTVAEVFNPDENETLICNLGAHPGFSLPWMYQHGLEGMQILFEEEEECERCYLDKNGLVHRKEPFYLPDRRIIIHKGFLDNRAIILDNIKSKKIWLADPAGRKQLEVGYNGNRTLAFWGESVKQPFLCVEPWAYPPDSTDEKVELMSRKNMLRIHPGERYLLTYYVKLMKLVRTCN